jgi:pheromone shutdown-related protein TraB
MSSGNPCHPVTAVVEPQPLVRLERDGVTFVLLGTAHVSRASAEAVEKLIADEAFDAVAIELDQNRYAALTEPDRWARLDLFQVIRQGKAGMVAANLALGAFQKRLADQVGIEPGEEMLVAIRSSKAAGLPLLLVDRDVGVTLHRTYRNIPWWQRFGMLGGLFLSTFSHQEISSEEIERLKQGDILESTLTEFAESSQALYAPLIAERDLYMAAKVNLEVFADDNYPSYKRVLLVVGAGHLQGLVKHLETGVVDPAAELERLDQVPPPGPWLKILPWIIVALILTGFGIGFSKSPQLGLNLIVEWFVINGVLACVGTMIALAHPITILGTFLAAPFTSLNPMIGAGFVAAGLELWLRKPKVTDFRDLRVAITSAGGWWSNRVARTLLVFLLATFGSALGTYFAGFRIFGKLFA